jgi:hypothetical protein
VVVLIVVLLLILDGPGPVCRYVCLWERNKMLMGMQKKVEHIRATPFFLEVGERSKADPDSLLELVTRSGSCVEEKEAEG